jgi:hypothetical protein
MTRFRRTGKAMGQVYQRWWMICREINVLIRVPISHVLHFISICDLFPTRIFDRVIYVGYAYDTGIKQQSSPPHPNSKSCTKYAAG